MLKTMFLLQSCSHFVFIWMLSNVSLHEGRLSLSHLFCLINFFILKWQQRAAVQRGCVGVDVYYAAGLYPVTHDVLHSLIFSLPRHSQCVCACMCVKSLVQCVRQFVWGVKVTKFDIYQAEHRDKPADIDKHTFMHVHMHTHAYP